MQIRLTVVDPLGAAAPARDRAASCDVLVTAPAGTALAAVASALASAVSGGEGSSGAPVLYAGDQRLDAQRCTLGEPPLIDGAVLAVGAPGEPEPHPELDDAPTRLHVVAGPDAGGVHLLHGGEIRIGRSADADVPLDDPDVSRLHCAVTVAPDGHVSVADLGSTNGTTLDGRQVGSRAVRLAPGALLRIGESALRLTPSDGPAARTRTTPDNEGHVRVGGPHSESPEQPTHHAYGGPGTRSEVPAQGNAPDIESRPDSARPLKGRRVSGPRQTEVPGPRPAQGASDPAVRQAGGARHDGAPEGPEAAEAGYATGAWPGGHDGTGDRPWAAHDSSTGPHGTGGPAGGQGIGDVAGARDRAGGHASAETPGSGARPHSRVHEGETAGGTGAPAQRRGIGGPAGHPADPRGETQDGTGVFGGHPRTGESPITPLGSTDGAGGRPGHHTADAGHLPADAHGAPLAPGVTARPGVGGGSGVPGGHPSGPQDAHPGTPTARTTATTGTASSAAPAAPVSPSAPTTTGLGRSTPRGAGSARRRGGITAWARRLAGGRTAADEAETVQVADDRAPAAEFHDTVPETWPDPAALLLTALGPGPRLWEREPGHPEALAVRLGTADRAAPDGSGRLLPAVPVTVGLREVGALGLAGPRERLTGLTRAVLAQLAALHSPDTLEIVLLAADRSRPLEERTAEWSWLGWLPHLRPGHGQDCRLLLAHDREQATARTEELLRRLDDPGHTPYPSPTAPARRPSWARDDTGGSDTPGPYSVLVVDGDPGGADVREAVARLAVEGPRAGIHVLCLAETPAASPASPVAETYEAACAVAPTFRECGAVALLSGDVATTLRLLRVARTGSGTAPGPVGHGTLATVDAVSAAWAERFARALAPLRPEGTPAERHPRVSAPLPQSARLLDELGLARATPASLMARWADAADDTGALGGRVTAVLGAGPRGPVAADLAADGPHLLVEGPPGSGRTELLRAVVASLAAAERPDRLGIVLVDGRGAGTPGAAGHGEGLHVCTDVPHVTTHLAANDPVRMREFAQSLSAELKRRAELLGRSDFAEWHTGRELSERMVAQRDGDLDTPPSSTLRLRPGAAKPKSEAAPPLPRLVVVVDDLDALVSPALGAPGRPAAGSVMRALEAVARDGERLGVHLVAATGPCARTAETEPVRRATLRVTLEAPAPGPDEPAPGRGRLALADGRVTQFQGGRVTGRIPRTATLRPTVIPLEWHRMGDPPTRRPVRELGNGPTDLALLASALERAAREVAAAEVPSLL
ncbi:FHA domain-containing protein [Streptomyces sp. NPDC052012]|uniref:FHA domain-containing protein n=1 Tax=Streptomyces sp. NPDC052012 TaxID=3155051 RepID=UPI00344BFE7C